MKKSLSILLAFVMFCSIVLQFDNAAYAGEVPSNVITNIRLEDESGGAIYNIKQWQAMKVIMAFKLLDNEIHEGDTTTITLPKELLFVDVPIKFDVKDSNGKVVAIAKVDHNKKTITLTYTDYPQSHSGVTGALFFYSRIDHEKEKEKKTITLDFKVGNEIINGGSVEWEGPGQANGQFMEKASWKSSTNNNGISYGVFINRKGQDIKNGWLEDELQTEKTKYIENSLKVYKGSWQWNSNISDYQLKNERLVTNEVSVIWGQDGRSFKLNFGDLKPSEGLRVNYKVKIGYIPVDGEIFKNKANLKGQKIEEVERTNSYKYFAAGGQAEGYVYKIQIKKKGEDSGNPLPGATFDVIRVRSGQTVGTITSTTDGTGELGGLLLDDYKLVETEAPKGYQKLKDPIFVKPEDFGTNKIALKNIVNKEKEKEKITVTVTKKWENPDGTPLTGDKPTISLQLLKDGQSEGNPVELTNGNTTHEWKNLDKTDKYGNDHKYSVQEVGETGYNIKLGNDWYKVTYGADQQNGLTVTNKKKTPWTPMEPPTRDLKVTKVWKDKDDNNLNAPVEKIEVELYKDGAATGNKKELTKANNWTAEFKKLPVSATLGGENHNYTVKETGESGNAIQLNNKWYEVIYGGTMKDGLIVTNKEKNSWTPMVPPTRDIRVTKVWQNDSGTEIVPSVDEITVELYQDGKTTGKTLKLTSANNWAATFEKLPVSATLGGKNYEYTIKEVGVNGEKIELAGTWYRVSYGGTMVDGFVITNEKEVKPEKPDKPDKPTSPGGTTPSNGPTPPDGTTPPGGTVPPSVTTPPDNPTQMENSTQTDKATKLNHSSKENKTTLLKKIAQSGRRLPKTGDGANPAVYALALFALGSLLTVVGYRRRKNVN